MPHQIILQPNGRLALWSDDRAYFCVYEASEEEITDFLVELPREQIARNTARTVKRLMFDDDVYGERTIGWDDALAEARETHKGKEAIEQIDAIEEAGKDRWNEDFDN